MKHIHPKYSLILLALIGLSSASTTFAQQAQSALSPAEQVLEMSGQQGRFTFLVFHKTEDAAKQAMVAAVKRGIADKAGDASIAFVSVASPAEKRLVDKLGISRAPMPLCVAFAPNGAVTGLFRKAPSVNEVTKAFVTPTMTRCMKAMQDGKIVLVCVQSSSQSTIPAAVIEFQADPDFKNRIATVDFDPQDPAEGDFLKQLTMDAANSENIATVMLAPPGVLVGKYQANATQSQIAAELHAAGKCCDDPNCKHHKHTHTKAPATSQKAPAKRR